VGDGDGTVVGVGAGAGEGELIVAGAADAVGVTDAKGWSSADETVVVHERTTPRARGNSRYGRLALARRAGDHGITAAPYTASRPLRCGSDTPKVAFATQTT
jgi:hypothetical protein